MAGITERDVWAAADAILLAGGRPTIERVRQKIGRGSPNTVTPHLDTWFTSLGARISDPHAFAAPPDVPDPILQIAKHLWDSAMSIARGQSQAAVDQAQQEAAASVQSALDQVALARDAAQSAIAQFERQSADLQSSRELVAQLQQDLAASAARLDESRSAVTAGLDRLALQEARELTAVADLRTLLSAANDRADAADRRVALELERERQLRAGAENRLQDVEARTERDRLSFEQRLDQVARRAFASEQREAQLLSQLQTLQLALATATADLSSSKSLAEQHALSASAAHAEAVALRESLQAMARLTQGPSTHGNAPALRTRNILKANKR